MDQDGFFLVFFFYINKYMDVISIAMYGSNNVTFDKTFD